MREEGWRGIEVPGPGGGGILEEEVQEPEEEEEEEELQSCRAAATASQCQRVANNTTEKQLAKIAAKCTLCSPSTASRRIL